MDELGQDSGLDPLGMQRPIEVIYQSPVGRDLMSGRPTRPSCLILEGYSVDVVLCFFGFGPPDCSISNHKSIQPTTGAR